MPGCFGNSSVDKYLYRSLETHLQEEAWAEREEQDNEEENEKDKRPN